jgi:tetratricopeptide (TPR) repeat protein
MELTIEQALQQGVVAHQGGKLKEAERLYRAVLQLQPLHPEANHNLGVLVISFGKVEVALPFFKTALDVNPDVEQFWYSYINALIKGQHRERAEEIAKKGRHYGLSGPDIDLLDGKIVQKLGKLDDAETNLRRAITLKLEFAAVHNILGLVFKDLGRKSFF